MAAMNETPRRQPDIHFIFAVGQNNEFGADGHLPWGRLEHDMIHFARVTSRVPPNVVDSQENVLLMGKNTWLSIPPERRQFKKRQTVVISSTLENELKPGEIIPKLIIDDVENAIVVIDSWTDVRDIYVIGGPTIFQTLLVISRLRSRIHSLYLTRVNATFRNATVSYHPDRCLRYFRVHDVKYHQEHEGVVDGNQVKYTIDRYFHIETAWLTHLCYAHEEYQYLGQVAEIMTTGSIRDDRTHVGTMSLFGRQMRFDLSQGHLPLMTTKFTFFRGIAEELLWFISGSTDSKALAAKGVHFWDANGSRANLDKLGFTERREGDLGPVYGFQLRHFGAQYVDCDTDYSDQGVDQLMECIDQLKRDAVSRRHIINLWNAADLKKCVLPPCHMFCQFYVDNHNRLSCLLYQRSGDMGLGVPFNIASYSLLTCMMAQVCGYSRGEFIHVIGDAHVYLNHIEPLVEQLRREPLPFPILEIEPSVADITAFRYEHFKLNDYQHRGRLPMEMAL